MTAKKVFLSFAAGCFAVLLIAATGQVISYSTLGKRIVAAANGGQVAALIGIDTNQVALTNIQSLANQARMGRTNQVVAYTGGSNPKGMYFSNLVASVLEQKREYDVRDFGAAVDGRYLVGNASGTSLTITSGALTAADAGKTVMIYGAGQKQPWAVTNVVNGVSYEHRGTNSWAFTTTIASVGSSTTATLSAAVSNAVTSQSVFIHTEDGPALQAAANWVTTNGGGTILIPGFLGMNRSMTDPGFVPYGQGVATPVGSRHLNAQIIFPPLAMSSGNDLVTVRFKGVLPKGDAQPVNPGVVNGTGAGIVSTFIQTNNGGGSMFNVENLTNPSFGAGQPANLYFNAVHIEFEDLVVRAVPDPQYSLLDLRGAPNYFLDKVFFDVGYGNAAQVLDYCPTFTNSFALLLPENNNQGTVNRIGSMVTLDTYWGVAPGEHANIGHLYQQDHIGALRNIGGGHQVTIENWDVALCKYIAYNTDQNYKTIFASLTSECNETNAFSYPMTIVYDPGSFFQGRLEYALRSTVTAWTNVGGTRLERVLHKEATRPVAENFPMLKSRLFVGASGEDESNLTYHLSLSKVPENEGAYGWRFQRTRGPSETDPTDLFWFDLNGNTYVQGQLKGGYPTGPVTPISAPDGVNVGGALCVTNGLVLGGSITDSSGNIIFRQAGNVAVLNPTAPQEEVYLSWDKGSGTSFGNGSAGRVARVNAYGHFQQVGTSTILAQTGNDGVYWNSNKVLFWVTATKTNLVSDGR